MSLYPVKLRRLLTELAKSGAMDAMAAEASANPVNSPKDCDSLRIALTSASVHHAVRVMLNSDHRFYVRIAIPQDTAVLWIPDETMVEVYDATGNSVFVPVQLMQVSAHLACAIEAELYHALLKAKGCDIPNN